MNAPERDSAGLRYEGESYELVSGESVLDCLLRHDVDIPHGCKSGVCQGCLLKYSGDSPPPGFLSQASLTESQKDAGYFLSCQTVPGDSLAGALEVGSRDFAAEREAELVDKSWLNSSVMGLRLRVKDTEGFQYRGGQYITLIRDSSCSRSYSIANGSPAHDAGAATYLELQVRHYPGGAMSDWIAKQLQPGDTVKFLGPLGSACYQGGQDRPLLLCGMGTGLAPMMGVLEEALNAGHCTPITLVVAASSPLGFYHQDCLRALADQHGNLAVHWVVPEDCAQEESVASTGAATDTVPTAVNIYDYVLGTFQQDKSARVYLAGAESFVTRLRKQLFLSGAALADISADIFVDFSRSGAEPLREANIPA